MRADLVIFVLPWEIEGYKRQINWLEENLAADSKINLTLYVCLCLSPDIVDWSASNIKLTDCKQAFNSINESIGNFQHKHIRIVEDSEALGCVDWRRLHLRQCDKDKVIIWLDSDIVFPNDALTKIRIALSENLLNHFILTPQIPRMWDDSWDVLVAREFINEPLGHWERFDTRKIHLISSNRTNNRTQTLDTFKFAGGWLTVFSAQLLRLIDIPDAFRPYGEEDTFIMHTCSNLKDKGWRISQILQRDIIVAQDPGIFDTSLAQFSLVYDKYADVAFNKAITATAIDEVLERLLAENK